MPAAKKKTATKPKAKKPVKPVHYRCEHCNQLVRAANIEMFTVTLPDGTEDKQDLCDKCVQLANRSVPKKELQWFAVAVVPGEDAKAKRALLEKKRTNLADKIGRVIIPREPQDKVTKDRYEAYSHGVVVGQLSNNDGPDEALWQAKQKWGDTHLISHVKLLKEGGEVKTQNRKAMPGYVLAQIDDSPETIAEVKATKHVLTMLPFFEKMTYEDLEDDVPPTPVPIPQAAIEKVVPKEKKVVVRVTPFAKGDRIRVVHGRLKGATGTIEEVLPDLRYKVLVQILSASALMEVGHSEITSN
jgi:transcription antitermination factor NusG